LDESIDERIESLERIGSHERARQALHTAARGEIVEDRFQQPLLGAEMVVDPSSAPRRPAPRDGVDGQDGQNSLEHDQFARRGDDPRPCLVRRLA